MKISNSQYAKILYSMTQGKDESQIGSAVSDFSRFIMEKKGSKRIEKIIGSFSKIWNLENKIIDCEISSAQPLTKENMKKIEEYVMGKYDAKFVNMKNVIRKEIKGGVVIRIGDEIVDASVEGQLKNLKRQLTS